MQHAKCRSFAPSEACSFCRPRSSFAEDVLDFLGSRNGGLVLQAQANERSEALEHRVQTLAVKRLRVQGIP